MIAIGEQAPRSATDFFVLNLCRARADAILTSAGNLRSEPGLVHSLAGPLAGELGSYRDHVLKKVAPPVVAILTRSGELPLEHPVWSDGTTKLVLTSPEARAGLVKALGSRAAEVVAFDELDARVAAAWLGARGLSLVSIEAGPRTTGSLYRAPAVVQELLLSLYEAPAEVKLGGALPDDAALFATRTLASDTVRLEESGAWRFQRWLRDP
ncbi:MAG: hypothetical protein JWN04_1773 [Myxococcaceae bacterium]|nr:hypothetical protein [Myxococcaceae bacterium]